MKRFTELSAEELAALSDDEIQTYIDVEVAYAQIVPVPEPRQVTLDDLGLVPTVSAYSVGGLLFKNQADAEMVAKLPMLAEDYDYSGAGYDFRWLKPAGHQVTLCNYYTEEEIRGRGNTLKEQQKRKENYKTELKKYQEYRKNVQYCANEVWEAVAKARRYKAEIDTARETLEKYLQLANQDEKVAADFFRNTYFNHPDILEIVLGEKSEVQEEEA